MNLRKSALYMLMWVFAGIGMFAGSSMSNVLLSVISIFAALTVILMFTMSKHFFDIAEDFSVIATI